MTIENNENVLNEKEKGITKNKLHIAKAVVEILNLNILYQKKKKQRKKQQRNTKGIMIIMTIVFRKIRKT